MINAMTKSQLGGKGSIWLTLPDHSLSLEEARQELKARTKKQELEQRPQRSAASRHALLAFLYIQGLPA